MGEIDLKFLKAGFSNKTNYLTKKVAYPDQYCKSLDDYQKPVNSSQKDDVFSKLEKKCSDDDEIERSMDLIKRFSIENAKELTQLFLKSDVLLLACVFEKLIKVSVNEFGINPLHCVSLPECGLKHAGINRQTPQDTDLLLTLETNIRGGISSVLGDRYVKSDEKK